MISISSEHASLVRRQHGSAPAASSIPRFLVWPVWRLAIATVVVGFLGLITLLQRELDQRVGRIAQETERIGLLPPGDLTKPAVLGFQSLGADMLWLQVLQVLGQREVSAQDYAWAYQALDIITTLDPHYVYAYDAGGLMLAEQGGQVEWSNQLLKKGLRANPEAWRLAFQLGFNYFFHLQDYRTAADYMAIAATLPGRPAYVPELAARLYGEAHHPELAITFLTAMRQDITDTMTAALLERRYQEALIERDLLLLDQAVQQYRTFHGVYPLTLEVLVQEHLLPQIPVEPIGGQYLLDAITGQVSSSTHPQRLRIYRTHEIEPFIPVRVLP